MNRQTVGILFGGRSAEHEVSIESARAVFNHIDRDRFEPLLIYIDPSGCWRRLDGDTLLRAESYRGSESLGTGDHPVYRFIPWANRVPEPFACDIYFPLLHGPNGEDGRMQGMLELASVPFTGADSFSSALAMNKAVAKMMFQRTGLDTPDFVCFRNTPPEKIAAEVRRKLTLPVFVKPNALGSSVGITKVKRWKDLDAAVTAALDHDRTIIIEAGVDAREIEVSVMGNERVEVSRPGELIPHNEFYDYADKYLDNQTRFHIPAELPPRIEETLRDMAERAYRALFLNGMSRVDFFLERRTDRVLINEINTIPGFTAISMFPKLWGLEGVSFGGLITRLIELGFAFHRR